MVCIDKSIHITHVLVIYTVWALDFKTLVCKFYVLFFSAKSAEEKEKKALLLGVSKSLVHTVIPTYLA
jgi:hypothetical protein